MVLIDSPRRTPHPPHHPPTHHFMFKTTLILITQADPTDLIRKERREAEGTRTAWSEEDRGGRAPRWRGGKRKGGDKVEGTIGGGTGREAEGAPLVFGCLQASVLSGISNYCHTLMGVTQYYLFKSLPLSSPHPLAVCNKAKELTQTQTASICLIILRAIILRVPLIRRALSLSHLPLALYAFGHRQTLSLPQ